MFIVYLPQLKYLFPDGKKGPFLFCSSVVSVLAGTSQGFNKPCWLKEEIYFSLNLLREKRGYLGFFFFKFFIFFSSS